MTAESMGPRSCTPYKVLRPRVGWQPLNAGEIWRYRHLLITLAARDLKLRYRQTALGALWVVLQPVLAAAVFALVFGTVARLPSEGQPYFLFSFAGLLCWNAFSGTLTRASTSLLSNAHLVSKVSFARLVLPLSAVLANLVDFGISLLVMAALMTVYGVHPSAGLLLLPLWLSLSLLLGLGIGLWVAALTVNYRDVQHALPVLTQLLLYASPVAYALSAVPERWRLLFILNPLSGLIEMFRWSLLGTGNFDPTMAVYSAAFSITAVTAGAFVFRRAERTFADVL